MPSPVLRTDAATRPMTLGLIGMATIESKKENKQKSDFILITISTITILSITVIFSYNYLCYIAGLLGSQFFWLICAILYFTSFGVIVASAMHLSKKILYQKCYNWKIGLFLLTIITCGTFSFIVSILNTSPSSLTFLHGFREKIIKRIDVAAIRKWAQEVEIPEEETRGLTINLKDAPRFVKNLDPDYDYVYISLEYSGGQDNKPFRVVSFRWDFIGGLALKVMPYGMKTPVISDGKTLEISPGVYIWNGAK